LFENFGTVQDGMNTLSIAHSVTDQVNAKPLQVSNGQIVFDQVSFAYGNGDLVFDQLSLAIKPNEKIGVIAARERVNQPSSMFCCGFSMCEVVVCL
jgi:ATP-binding cassette subfamily B multidrug efflux pump